MNTRLTVQFLLFSLGLALTSAQAATIRGVVEFEADYPSVFHGRGQIPVGPSPMPYLYVCAWNRSGPEIDFKYTDFPERELPPGPVSAYGSGFVTDVGDELLGCAQTDTTGAFRITTNQQILDLYLNTRLCNDVLRGPQSDADVCVRINHPEGDESWPENIKTIWSRVYSSVDTSDDVVDVVWNLSCPQKYGLGVATLTCGGAVEPDDWSNGCRCTGYPDLGEPTCPIPCPPSGNCGDTNSRYGCNKEAVHAFRAAVEPFKTWESNKPTAGNTFAKEDCPGTGIGFCDSPECQDEIKVHLASIQKESKTTYANGQCNPEGVQNGARDYDDTCIRTPWNPFRVVHELGHVVDMRWRCSKKGHSGAAGWDANATQRAAVREGFANFFSVAAWFNASSTAPVYCGESVCHDVESASGLSPCSTSPYSEGHMTQFFWDLRDDNDGGADDDTVRWTFQKIRNIWSAFPVGTDDMETDEGYLDDEEISVLQRPWAVIRDNGANVWDFTYHWDQKRGLTPAYCGIMEQNCVDQHFRCESCGGLCP